MKKAKVVIYLPGPIPVSLNSVIISPRLELSVNLVGKQLSRAITECKTKTSEDMSYIQRSAFAYLIDT